MKANPCQSTLDHELFHLNEMLLQEPRFGSAYKSIPFPKSRGRQRLHNNSHSKGMLLNWPRS